MMRVSIRIKLLVMSVLLVLLTTVSLSTTYYIQARRYMQRESQKRIHIAFDIMLTDFAERAASYTTSVQDFLETNDPLKTTTAAYLQDPSRIGSISFISSNLAKAAGELRRFAHVQSAQRLMLYGHDLRLMAIYQQRAEHEDVAIYVPFQEGEDVYIPVDDPATLTSMLLGREAIPEIPTLSSTATRYQREVPETISTVIFAQGVQPGIRVTAPLYDDDVFAGLLIFESVYTQQIIEQYASLSKTHINFFIGNKLGVGTLGSYTTHVEEHNAQLPACDDELRDSALLAITTVMIEDQRYYQGQCGFEEIQGILTVNLSQQVEEWEMATIFRKILLVAGLTVVIASIIPWFFSRSKIKTLYGILRVIIAASEGDLRPSSISVTNDEIGTLGQNVQRMISHLRTLSGKAQDATQTVNGTADTILRQLDMLSRHMEQQSASVENTTDSVEKIDHFIDAMAQNTSVLLVAAAQILSSIQETRASIQGVTTSTDALTTDLHLISSAVEQVNHSMKDISDNTGQLAEAAHQTETEIQHIDQSLRDVSQNADWSQQLAKDTMEAAVSGQASVDASLRGMLELKEVVAHTAQIIGQINSWGKQVSSILGIVDDITEQTSLLALNASIISAQAGRHGRGFAVVADEIKSLAMRTKASTKEIDTLIRQLQASTEQGVQQTAEGISKAEEGVNLAHAVQDALATILERATLASTTATDTAHVSRDSAASSQAIRTSMTRVTEMVSSIRAALQRQEQDIEQVASAVENISGMAEQVNRASVEQTKATEEVERSMEDVTEKFNSIAEQTDALKQDSHQIVTAMRVIESTTENILRNVTGISTETVKNLLTESDALQQIVSVFRIS